MTEAGAHGPETGIKDDFFPGTAFAKCAGMKILLLNQFYRPDVAATGQLLGDLGTALSRAGHDVYVLCSRKAYGAGDNAYPTCEKIDGVHVSRVRAFGFGRGTIIGRLADYLSFYLLALYKSLSLPKMDVCIALTTPPFIGLVGAVLKHIRGTRLLLWTMDLYPEVTAAFGVLREQGWLYGLLMRVSRYLYDQASDIISLGDVMTQRLVAAGAPRHKIHTIPNWVPGESVLPMEKHQSPLHQKWGLNGETTVMYSGNLGLGHDLSTVIRGIHRMKERTRTRLLIVGAGKSMAPLQEQAKVEAMDYVDFHDPVPLTQLQGSLALGDIQIVSQRCGTEGLIVPSKLLGILAAGRPVLFIGPKECETADHIQRSGAGLIVPPGDADAVTRVLSILVGNPYLRQNMGLRARRYYETHLGRERSLFAILEVVLSERQPIEDVHPQLMQPAA